MKKVQVKSSLILLTTLALVFAGCRKDREIDNDTSTASDNQLAENVFTEVKNMTDAVVAGTFQQTVYKSSDTLVTGCATITHDTTVSPRLITINFGTSNCSCADGKNRRGIIMVSYTGPYRDSGTVITHSFSNYYVNDNQITGTKTVTNKGRNTSNLLHYAISVSAVIYKATGGTITWNSTRTRTWVAGESTILNWLDDEYDITGSGSGTSANGTSFTVNIITPLRVKLNCPRIVSGIVDITPSGKPTRTLNYGSGVCDYVATVTINGNTYTITLF